MTFTDSQRNSTRSDTHRQDHLHWLKICWIWQGKITYRWVPRKGTSDHAGDGLVLTGARIVSAVRCAPPGNAPTPAERATCGHWLRREIDLVTPTVTGILALGQIAWNATFGALSTLGWQVPRPRPAFGHGATAHVVPPSDRARARTGVAVVGSYHVSQQNTFTGRLTKDMLDAAIAACAGDQQEQA